MGEKKPIELGEVDPLILPCAGSTIVDGIPFASRDPLGTGFRFSCPLTKGDDVTNDDGASTEVMMAMMMMMMVTMTCCPQVDDLFD